MEQIYRENNFWSAVYGWMASALMLTAVTAWYVAATPQLFAFFIERPFVLLLLFVAQIGMVFVFMAVLKNMHFGWALIAFFLYALTLGITLSALFKVYVASSIYVTFFVAAGMFGCMALYGFFTSTDLSGVGSIMIMMLFGIIICSLVNLFVQSSAFDTAISFVGVVVFSLLTAYDMQKLRLIEQNVENNSMLSFAALSGAFTLYLDFINLFLMLLRFTGKRNND
jgi:FtsH-binding integral membrane protein